MAKETTRGSRRRDDRPEKDKQIARKQTSLASSSSAYVRRTGLRMRKLLCPNLADIVGSSESEQETATIPPAHTSLNHGIENEPMFTYRGRSRARIPSQSCTARFVVERQRALIPAPHRLRCSLQRRFRCRSAGHTRSADARPTLSLPTTHARLMARFPIFATDSEDHAASDRSHRSSPESAVRSTPVRSAAATTQVASTSSLQLPGDRLGCVDSASTLIPRDARQREYGEEHEQAQIEQTGTRPDTAREPSKKSKGARSSASCKADNASTEFELPGASLVLTVMQSTDTNGRRQATVPLSSLQVHAFRACRCTHTHTSYKRRLIYDDT